MVSLRCTYACHWLFSQTKSTGRFHTAARFSASWKIPSVAAPSPKKTTAMASVSCIESDRPTPVDSDSSPPTMVEVSTTPRSLTEMCRLPLFPLQ
jgi:hypothetical protein